MLSTHEWHVEIYLSEDERHTRAEAVLRTHAGTELRHVGTALRNPKDRPVPEIGAELAACRALSGLAHDLFEAGIADVEGNTGEPVEHLSV